MMAHQIEWLDRGHPPRVAPNPDYPDGIPMLDVGNGAKHTCTVELPYPTGHVNVGTWIIECDVCRLRVGVTAASRPDDARSVRVPCKIMEGEQ
jgi:hypothetical protein